jgi:hypothetical protein
MVMVVYRHRHKPDAVARLSLLLCSLFTSLLLGVAVSRAETPNFIIKHTLRGDIGLARPKAFGKLTNIEPAGVG